MPIIKPLHYKAPFYLLNSGNLQTIIPSLFRQVEGVNYRRERLATPDHDFIDLDWSLRETPKPADRLLIVSHGLEGSSNRHYVKGLIKVFNRAGWDGLGWNCRSCSGELNKLPRFYHHGDTDDLAFVVDHAIKTHSYRTIVLAGFSLGGSMVLKYMGERGENVPDVVKKGIAVSVPCDLAECGIELSKRSKLFYTNRFLKRLGEKVKEKAQAMPGRISYEGYEKIRNFKQFDNTYTAPLHGFKDADHYYQSVSAKGFLAGIRKPTLLLNALNDPFLTPGCFPVEQAEKNPFLFLEMPPQGGHVGFNIQGAEETYAERRAIDWVKDIV